VCLIAAPMVQMSVNEGRGWQHPLPSYSTAVLYVYANHFIPFTGLSSAAGHECCLTRVCLSIALVNYTPDKTPSLPDQPLFPHRSPSNVFSPGCLFCLLICYKQMKADANVCSFRPPCRTPFNRRETLPHVRNFNKS